jgi:hypothetical protein
MNACNGVASTASATTTTPATLTIAASCPVFPALTVSACTAVQTVTVPALSGASGVAAPTLAARHFHGNLKKRAVDF